MNSGKAQMNIFHLEGKDDHSQRALVSWGLGCLRLALGSVHHLCVGLTKPVPASTFHIASIK